MTEAKQENSWDVFWRGSYHAEALTGSPAQDAGLLPHWMAFFSHEAKQRSRCRSLDLACGTGVVSTIGHKAFLTADSKLESWCVDYSPAALKFAHERISGLVSVVADCAVLPFSDCSFDLVVSQFGLEYMQRSAFSEAARSLAKGGAFCAIAHLHDGAVYHECDLNRRAAGAILACDILPAAKAAFLSIEQKNSGRMTDVDVTRRRQDLARAVATLKQDAIKYGNAADGLAGKLFADLGKIFQSPERYRTDEVLNWCEDWEREVGAYINRMSAMTQAALNKTQYKEVLAQLAACGLEIDQADSGPVFDGADPIAWRLQARR